MSINTAPFTGFLARHSGQILTSVAVSGVVTTSVLAARGHLEAQTHRYEIEPDNRGKTIANAFKARWKCYAPAVVTGIITISAIVLHNRLDAKKIAAIGAAYSASNEAFSAYKKSVADHIKKPETIKEIEENAAINQQKEHPIGEAIFVGDGKVLCYDCYTGRYFSASMEDVRRAVNDVNKRLISEDYAPLNEFYSALGLEEVKVGDDLGWNVDHMCDVVFGTSMTTDGKPSLAISFKPDPIPVWWTR